MLKHHAVMMLVSRRVKPGCETEFERVMAAFIQVASNFPGCMGAQLVHPGDESDVEDSLYHAILAFESQDDLRAWQASPERIRGLDDASRYVEGQAIVREVSGLSHWFQVPNSAASVMSPPRWKIAAVTWLGIFPTVYLLFFLLGDLLASWLLAPRLLLITFLAVTIMTWIVAPRLTRLLKPWLYRSN